MGQKFTFAIPIVCHYLVRDNTVSLGWFIFSNYSLLPMVCTKSLKEDDWRERQKNQLGRFECNIKWAKRFPNLLFRVDSGRGYLVLNGLAECGGPYWLRGMRELGNENEDKPWAVIVNEPWKCNFSNTPETINFSNTMLCMNDIQLTISHSVSGHMSE